MVCCVSAVGEKNDILIIGKKRHVELQHGTKRAALVMDNFDGIDETFRVPFSC